VPEDLNSPDTYGNMDVQGETRWISRADLIVASVGLAILALTVWIFLHPPFVSFEHFFQQHSLLHGSLTKYKQFQLLQNSILLGAFLAAFCLVPALDGVVRALRLRWRALYSYAALLGICAFLSWFLIHAGRWQYGGFDCSIMIETGWRLLQGQRAYVDFPTTTAPGFNLGIKFAFQLFGVTWDANLYLCAIYACLTFLWMYWLMRRLEMGRLAAMTISFAIESAAMLTICYWWYNNSVMILAAVFFLSCLVYASKHQTAAVQLSYVLSLALLSLMKPNMAGLMIAGAVALLLVVTERKLRLLLLTLAATAVTVVVLLLNHVSIPAMLASYLSIAKSRGSVSSGGGFQSLGLIDLRSAFFWIAALSIPMLGLAPRIFRLAGNRDWRGIIYCLFFPFALLFTLYGIATNGEYRDVGCTVLLATGAVLVFGLRCNGSIVRRVYIAIVLAAVASDLSYGAKRVRIYGIGEHIYFEWTDNQQRIENGFLKNMRASSALVAIEREVSLATKANSGPYFFGPRMEFNYAAFALPSPKNFPVWWDPGTAFVKSQQAPLIQGWQQHRFQTLIFLKSDYAFGPGPASDVEDYTFYPKEFRAVIDHDYTRDESYPNITVYHRRIPPSEP